MSEFDLDSILNDALDQLDAQTIPINNSQDSLHEEILKLQINDIDQEYNIKDNENNTLNDMIKALDDLDIHSSSESNTGNDENLDSTQNDLINNVMSQLLSKEIMYEPTLMICQKFPLWIEQNKENLLNKNELSKYENMFQSFKQLLHAYEQENPCYQK